MTPRETVAARAARYAELDSARFARRLSSAERQELDWLDYDRTRRLARLPGQIAATQAKLLRLNAELLMLGSPTPPTLN